MMDRLDELFAEELRKRCGELEERQIKFERHNPALFSLAAMERGEFMTGEVAHFHRPQGFLHLHLDSADIRLVVERGGGELHGLAGRVGNLPAGYALLYAPRVDAEFEAARTILRATPNRATGRMAPD